MSWFDSHCHLKTFWEKGELSAVIQRAQNASVLGMVTVGTSPKDWNIYSHIATEYQEMVYYSIGLHPGYVDEYWEQNTKGLRNFWDKPLPPVAFGEIGLDYFRLPSEEGKRNRMIDNQKAAFTKQLEWAKELDCPVIVHSRSAFDDCVNLIDASGLAWRNVVFHCFSEGAVQLNALLARGGVASFTGIVTFKNNDLLRQTLRLHPFEKLMLETDSPYLAPVPKRGKQNEPSYLSHIGEYLAENLQINSCELAAKTFRATRKFYRLPI